MDFPIVDLMDPAACYQFLLDLLHPDGLRRPGCGREGRVGVQARHRAPVLDYRCGNCGRVFNAYTGTNGTSVGFRLSLAQPDPGGVPEYPSAAAWAARPLGHPVFCR
jgi:hypothetical protein